MPRNLINFAPSKNLCIAGSAKRFSTYQHGLAFIELMIATALSMFIVLAITGLIISAKAAQSTQSDAANIQDTARFALDNISRSVRQAGYVNLDIDDAPIINTDNMSPSIIGTDADSLDLAQYGIDLAMTKSSKTLFNSSDVLVLRFFGSGHPVDDTVLNCAGFGVPAAKPDDDPEQVRGWSIYYVGRDVTNEPALFCQYHGDKEFKSAAIARGVESFQVLYGLQADSATEKQFLSAQQIVALDAAIPAPELNQNTHWKKVSAVKVAMLIRGAENSRMDPTTNTYHLFGEAYSRRNGSFDKGIQIDESNMPVTQRKRLRKIVNTTIQLRNALN